METTVLRTRTVAGEYRLVFALASYRHASGHTFLIHKAIDNPTHYSATYAPVGMHAGSYDSIDGAIDRLAGLEADRVTQVIQDNLERLEREYTPTFAPECGITGTWRDRERWRFETGEYRALPKLNALADVDIPTDHFVHVSVESDDMVAYTQNAEHGERDRQTRIKLGKYLKKMFPAWSDSAIQETVIEYRVKMSRSVDNSLKFATDRATIDDIFETTMSACNSGMTSCMHGKFTSWVDRPYHVYADSPDVAIAYLTIDGEIRARSVVSTKDKVWIRLYSVGGCETICGQLKAALEELGYTHGDLAGNRLTKLPKRSGRVHVLPYIDGNANHVTADHRYWIVSDDSGEFKCTCTDGTADECDSHTCERCEHDEDDCQCSTCECCEESYYEDRNCSCEFCQWCYQCTHHGNCECNICSECEHPIGRGRRSDCECDRCNECGELVDNDCTCDRCGTCNALESDCECETETESEETETETEDKPYVIMQTASGLFWSIQTRAWVALESATRYTVAQRFEIELSEGEDWILAPMSYTRGISADQSATV